MYISITRLLLPCFVRSHLVLVQRDVCFSDVTGAQSRYYNFQILRTLTLFFAWEYNARKRWQWTHTHPPKSETQCEHLIKMCCRCWEPVKKLSNEYSLRLDPAALCVPWPPQHHYNLLKCPWSNRTAFSHSCGLLKYSNGRKNACNLRHPSNICLSQG